MKTIKKFIFILLIINIFLFSGFTSVEKQAFSPYDEATNLSIPYQEFISFLTTLNPEMKPSGAVLGVFIPGQFSLPVLQQPSGHPEFVSGEEETLTQFSLVSAKNSFGLLAHNHLAGKHFSELTIGDYVIVVTKEKTKIFQISQILDYQALSPNSPYSNFKLLDGSDKIISASQLFSDLYTNENTLVLQTCISKDDELSWGRKFVIANEKEITSISDYFDYGLQYSFAGNQ